MALQYGEQTRDTKTNIMTNITMDTRRIESALGPISVRTWRKIRWVLKPRRAYLMNEHSVIGGSHFGSQGELPLNGVNVGETATPHPHLRVDKRLTLSQFFSARVDRWSFSLHCDPARVSCSYHCHCLPLTTPPCSKRAGGVSYHRLDHLNQLRRRYCCQSTSPQLVSAWLTPRQLYPLTMTTWLKHPHICLLYRF